MDFVEQRREPRERLELPVELGAGVRAVTRDISPSGMYLEVRGSPAPDGTLFFEMHLEEARMKFTAEGHIVRVDHGDGFTGIAVRLVSPRLDSLG